jgi:hypothetical protein
MGHLVATGIIGFSRTCIGRRRYLPGSTRDVIHVTQSCAANRDGGGDRISARAVVAAFLF